jgi:16S rRNA processing protein RimM
MSDPGVVMKEAPTPGQTSATTSVDVSATDDRIVTLGKIVGSFGVKGWIKVHSYTDPLANILDYEVWQLKSGGDWTSHLLQDGRETDKGVQAKVEGIENPEDARMRVGTEIGVWRSEMPATEKGEYYWSDLEGLDAFNLDGELLGRIDHFRTTPAGTIVVVQGQREHWVPFVKERISKVDIEAGRVVLDWPLEWP